MSRQYLNVPRFVEEDYKRFMNIKDEDEVAFFDFVEYSREITDNWIRENQNEFFRFVLEYSRNNTE